MDGLRGAAVLLIVAFHAATLMRYVQSEAPAAVVDVNDWLAPFRIPLLMVLSGLLVPRSLAKGPGRYVSGKLQAIAWPYVLWIGIWVVLTLPVSGWLVHVRGNYLSGSWLWYLSFLLVYYGVALVARPVHPLVVAALALVGAELAPDGSKYGERFLFLLAVFMIGVWLGSRDAVWQRLLSSRTALVVASALLVISYSVLLAQGSDLRYGPHLLVTSLCGVLLVIRLARACSATQPVELLAVCGRHSIVFYVMHVPVIFAVAHAPLTGEVFRSGLPAGVTYAAFLAAAVGVPALCVVALERWPASPLAWLFRWPARRRRSATAAVGGERETGAR